jgi:hypothetical protein
MAKASNPPLTITGVVVDRRNDVSDDDPTAFFDLADAVDVGDVTGADLIRIEYRPGDMALRERLDMHGRNAIAGGHSNYGYSGYFKASIFDGKSWRNLSIWSLLPANGHRYASQGEKGTVRARLVGAIEERMGRVVEYRNKAYRFADEPDPSRSAAAPPV